MARKSEMRYIQFYTDGSAARQIEQKPRPRKTAQLPRPRRQKKMVLRVDLVALSGILVAAVMLILMVVGATGLAAANREVSQMESYLSELEEENTQLQQTYHSGYDSEVVREQALRMGMIPADQATVVQIQVEDAPQTDQAETNSLWAFLTGLFA